VLRYLGRYTHRVAISNHRLLAFEQERVTFRWKDYAHGSKPGTMTLGATEFLRRFFLHVLPKGFVRIRHFGFLANRFRASHLASGAVFSGSLDGHLRAFSTEDGHLLWDFDTVRDYFTVNGVPAKGGSIDGAGPVVVDGVLYLNSGYPRLGGMPGNALLAFSVDGK
jgi:outer membrane protein assembly factor BamB